MLLYYHGQLCWVARSCRLPYSQREIRYGARVVLADILNWTSSGHLRRYTDDDTPKQCLSHREIRYGCQQRSWRPSQMLHQVTYDVVATLRSPNNARAV
eukprot:scaffold894_cov219-Skeletonema_marinoi.AAC.2